MGWWACSDDGWPLVAEILTDSGKPWDRVLCLDDLAYWTDRVAFTSKSANPVRFPSLNALSKRWNRTRKFVTGRMSETGWQDRQKVAGEGQGSSRRVAGEGQPAKGETPAITSSVAGEGHPSSRAVAGQGQLLTYGGARPTQHPTPTSTPEDKNSGSENAKAVWDYWKTWHNQARVFRKADKGFVNGRLAEGHTVEELCSIVKWAHEGKDWQADKLQTGGYTGLSTLMKPTNFDTRLVLATRLANGTTQKPKNGGATHGEYQEPEGFLEAGNARMEAYWDEQDRLAAEAEKGGAEA